MLHFQRFTPCFLVFRKCVFLFAAEERTLLCLDCRVGEPGGLEIFSGLLLIAHLIFFCQWNIKPTSPFSSEYSGEQIKPSIKKPVAGEQVVTLPSFL